MKLPSCSMVLQDLEHWSQVQTSLLEECPVLWVSQVALEIEETKRYNICPQGFYGLMKKISRVTKHSLWSTPFPIWNQSVVPCPVLTVAFWPAYRPECWQLDVGNLISGSFAFSKTSLNIWKITVHVLLKPGFRILYITLLACEMSAIVK